MDKLIITAALTGGLHGKEANPALPEQPDEIIADAVRCREAGAAIVHLHARDPEGRGVGDPGIFGRINEGILESCDVVVQNTTGGPGIPIERRISSLDAAPDMASLNMGSVVFFTGTREEPEETPFFNLRSEIEAFASEMLTRGIKPEMEVYNPSMLGEVDSLIEKGLLAEPYYVNFVMNVGGMGGYPGTPANLVYMVEMLPEGALFNVTGIGRAQLPLNTMSIIMGGHVRVGLEDNVYYRKGELAESNAQFVERVVRLAAELGREVASPAEARTILHL
ncbi:MAG: 3-keto-5-aminohexanoate cleavage protein [Actinobacteria bacterium]|nr:3-keto-5-aminohexanoate cleavage protein [Actinomycetota bacterium]MBU1944901.1 3-keto-5-aminohexanoate cleavage protein [Actinomycetota bacterium]MBU2688105.1 3-keto-5-aminohexanoate cleavage protein [Actinomycetota bacterium]